MMPQSPKGNPRHFVQLTLGGHETMNNTLSDHEEDAFDFDTLYKKVKMTPEEEKSTMGIIIHLLAQAYYQLLASSVGNPIHEYDMTLNSYYCWTRNNISDLITTCEVLQDFPERFAPPFDYLTPNEIVDVDWDMISGSVEFFLAATQDYCIKNNFVPPRPETAGAKLIDHIHEPVLQAIEYAEKYRKRMLKLFSQYTKASAKRMVSKKLTNSTPPKSDHIAEKGKTQDTIHTIQEKVDFLVKDTVQKKARNSVRNRVNRGKGGGRKKGDNANGYDPKALYNEIAMLIGQGKTQTFACAQVAKKYSLDEKITSIARQYRRYVKRR